MAKGYVSERITQETLDAGPELLEQMTAIYNQAFATRAVAGARDGEDLRRRLKDSHTGIIALRRNGRVAGFSTWIVLEKEVVGNDIAVGRRHWGTGAADLLCCEVISAVHAVTDKPIVTYVDLTNKASRHMLVRVGFRKVGHLPIWQLRVAPDEAPCPRMPR